MGRTKGQINIKQPERRAIQKHKARLALANNAEARLCVERAANALALAYTKVIEDLGADWPVYSTDRLDALGVISNTARQKAESLTGLINVWADTAAADARRDMAREVLAGVPKYAAALDAIGADLAALARSCAQTINEIPDADALRVKTPADFRDVLNAAVALLWERAIIDLTGDGLPR